MTIIITLVTLGLAVLLDVAATVLIIRSTVATPLQKALQLASSWAIPFVGSIIVIAVVKETIDSPQSRRGSSSSDAWLPGNGPESEGTGGHHGHHGGGGDVGHGGDVGGH